MINANIFFFVTTIAVVVWIVLMLIAGYYIVPTLRNIRDTSKILKDKSKEVSDNIADAIEGITENRWFNFILGPKKKKKSSK